MKPKGKVLLSSFLSIALCASIATGATYALFTSEAPINIAITQGNVEVVAAVSSLQWKSNKIQDWQTAEAENGVYTTVFDNVGSSASLSGNSAALTNMLPGDAIKFTVSVQNNSNVDVLYRTFVKCSEGQTAFETSNLNVTVTQNNVSETFNGADWYSNWELLSRTTENSVVGTVTVEIELPASADGGSGPINLVFAAEALQGNATIIPNDAVTVSSFEELEAALANGGNIYLAANISVTGGLSVSKSAAIYSQGYTINRAEEYTGTIFSVLTDNTLTIENITLDGSGATATGNLIATEGNGSIILNEGTILQNNVGDHAVDLATRGGGSLTLNGAKIINNSSDSGAIWGGGNIIVNEGSKISGNSSTGSAGAIRMVSDCNLTLNGGEISNNTAAGDGGAIWGYGASTYNFNGGVMANNTANGSGGAIYTGGYSVVNISGDFELSNNEASDAGALRLSDHTQFNMTGGKVSGNVSINSDEDDGFYGWNPAVNITGGELSDSILIQGGLTPTVGGDGITGIVNFDLSTNHYTINLASEFGTIKFTVNEDDEHFINCNFKPAEGYTYTEGDEAKLICMNEGYTTYWDAETETFRLRAPETFTVTDIND